MIYLRLRWDSAFIHRFDKLVTSAGTLGFIVVRLEDGRNLIISIVTHTHSPASDYIDRCDRKTVNFIQKGFHSKQLESAGSKPSASAGPLLNIFQN